jgi:hypothetical protein
MSGDSSMPMSWIGAIVNLFISASPSAYELNKDVDSSQQLVCQSLMNCVLSHRCDYFSSCLQERCCAVQQCRGKSLDGGLFLALMTRLFSLRAIQKISLSSLIFWLIRRLQCHGRCSGHSKEFLSSTGMKIAHESEKASERMTWYERNLQIRWLWLTINFYACA